MSDTRHVELIGAGMMLLMIVGTITAIGASLPSEQSEVEALGRKLDALSARLDIERGEREDLARRLRNVAKVVSNHDAELELQAGAIEMLEEESRATDDEVEREWPRAASPVLWARPHP